MHCKCKYNTIVVKKKKKKNYTVTLEGRRVLSAPSLFLDSKSFTTSNLLRSACFNLYFHVIVIGGKRMQEEFELMRTIVHAVASWRKNERKLYPTMTSNPDSMQEKNKRLWCKRVFHTVHESSQRVHHPPIDMLLKPR